MSGLKTGSIRAGSIVLLLAMLLGAQVARAQTVIKCGQAPNLACANGAQTAAQDVTTLFNFNVGAEDAFTIDGDTDDSNLITVQLTGDPAANFNFSIPHDGHSAAGKAISCSAGQFVNAFSATTGTFTCDVATSASVRWDQITDPTANLSLAMAGRTTTFTWGATTGSNTNLFNLTDTTGNTGTGYLQTIATASGSAAKLWRATALGTSNGVHVDAAGKLEKLGTGIIEASALVCTTCVDTGDIANNAVDGTKIGIGTTNGDLIAYDGTDWARLASAAGFLKSPGSGQMPAYGAITSSDIGPSDLQNALVWNESCTTSPCTLANAPVAATRALVVQNTIVLRRITGTCDGNQTNEYTLSGNTLTFCGTAPGAAPNNALVSYEL